MDPVEPTVESMSTPRREITLHDGPGQGRKQCPSCKAYVGSRVLVCKCNYSWKENKIVSSPVILAPRNEGAGKGKKKCPQCGNYSGVRTQQCACNYIWPKKDAAREEFQEDAPKETQYRERAIYTPAYACPVKLGGMMPSVNSPKNDPVSQEEIFEWADKLMAHGQSQNIRYAAAAARYYLRHFYDMYTPLWTEALAMLENWINPEPVYEEQVDG